jgi:bifunctional DNA-binding transcriptional regulator/antitoxin component of YhaV-PrlF toxin-antitoxin module
VPYEVRQAMGVRPGDKLEFETNGTGCSIRPVRAKDPFEKFRGIGTPGIGRGRKAVLRWSRQMRGR